MTKRNIAIIIIVLVVVSVVVFSMTRKSAPKYTTAEVKVGEVLQTVSATGTVEATKKLDLRFVNSGKISEIKIKVGDHLEKGAILAKLDTTQLESQLAKAKASVSAAAASLDKIVKGAMLEDIKVSETAVENAQIALENARSNLANAELNAEKEISKAQASVESAKVALDNVNTSLENTKITNENNLNQDYDGAWNTVNSSLLTAFDSLNTNKTTLEYEDAKNTLSILNIQYLNDSTLSKGIAGDSYKAVKVYTDGIKSNLTRENIDKALVDTKSMLDKARVTLGDTGNVLSATITSSELSQTELDTLKSGISTARTNINAAISNITTAQQNIQSQKVSNQTSLDSAQSSVNSAASSLDLANQTLLAVKAASDTSVNSAKNALRSAEGSLKQAQDQLALKKAGASASEISVYSAQLQEAQANMNLIQSQIEDSTLILPQSGIITEIKKEIGETISLSENFATVITAENFEIKANISEVDIAKVKIDDPVKITFDALGSDKLFTGKILKIDPAQTEVSGVIYYKVTTVFSGDSDIIKPGMTANLDIMTAKKENVVTIPFQALKEKNGEKYVQVLEGDKVRDVAVEIGLKGDIDLEVISGLQAGKKVVTFMEE